MTYHGIRVNEAMAKYMGSIVELDVAKIPKDWSITKWLYFARKSGISVVDSFKEGQRGQWLKVSLLDQ